MNKLTLIVLSLSMSAILAGCGAKGPLILPEKAAPIDAPADEPTDNTPQIEAPATPVEQKADEQAEDAVDTPTTPAPNG